MAIITCLDCNKEMSDAATACPQCGKPNGKISTSRPVGIFLGIGILFIPIVFAWFTLRKGHSTKSRIISFCWLVLSLVVIASGNKSNNNSTESSSSVSSTSKIVETPKKEEAVLDVTPNELAYAYSDNTIAADQKFKGKIYRVSGMVVDINTDVWGNPYITMQGGDNPFMLPQFKFEKSELAQLANLKKGTRATLVCVGKGDIAKIPMSESCTME